MSKHLFTSFTFDELTMPEQLRYHIHSLLDRVAEGDEQSFRLLFDLFKEQFHTVAFRMTRSAEIANDIVQEVFVTIWLKRKLIAKAKKPEEYIYTLLQNTVYFHFRKMARERKVKNVIGQESELLEDRLEIQLAEKEKKEIVEDVIGRMPAQQQTIYKLSKQYGLSRDEIAIALNISPHTVRNHLAAAIQFLHRYLKKGALIFLLDVTARCL